jgi:hypothetical protein
VTRPRHTAPPLGVPVVDDLSRARGKRIAQQQTADEIRAELRALTSLCPSCQQPLRGHTNTQLSLCALALDDDQPQGA